MSVAVEGSHLQDPGAHVHHATSTADIVSLSHVSRPHYLEVLILIYCDLLIAVLSSRLLLHASAFATDGGNFLWPSASIQDLTFGEIDHKSVPAVGTSDRDSDKVPEGCL